MTSKFEVAGTKYQGTERPNDLVRRTFLFAVQIRAFVNILPRSTANGEDIRQLVRSSGSVAANYLEAQEGLSRKDFFFRIRLCRKEARESGLWLRLVDVGRDAGAQSKRDMLVDEADQLTRIFAAITSKESRQESGRV